MDVRDFERASRAARDLGAAASGVSPTVDAITEAVERREEFERVLGRIHGLPQSPAERVLRDMAEQEARIRESERTMRSMEFLLEPAIPEPMPHLPRPIIDLKATAERNEELQRQQVHLLGILTDGINSLLQATERDGQEQRRQFTLNLAIFVVALATMVLAAFALVS
jgi:hypothetical protein